MESGKDTAGNCDKEDRDKVVRIKVIAIRKHAAVSRQCPAPVIPQFYKGISLYKQTDKYAQRGKQQDCSENRINTADDLIDREYSSDQIINKDQIGRASCRERV